MSAIEGNNVRDVGLFGESKMHRRHRGAFSSRAGAFHCPGNGLEAAWILALRPLFE
jgi:hypothetical protein